LSPSYTSTSPRAQHESDRSLSSNVRKDHHLSRTQRALDHETENLNTRCSAIAVEDTMQQVIGPTVIIGYLRLPQKI
jgi:hypothetical protein